MDHSTPGLPVHHQLPEFTQAPVHRVGDAIPPSLSPRLLPPSVLPGRYSLPKAGRVSPCPSVSPPRLHTSTFFPLPCPPCYSGTNAVSRRLRVELRKWTGGGEGSVLLSGEEAALCIQIRCRDYLPGSGASLPWSDFPFPWGWGRAVWVPSPLGTERPKHETGAAL